MKAVDTQKKLSVERLRQLLRYDPEDGKLVWIAKSSPNSHVAVGSVAGSLDNTGYIRVWIDGDRYVAHRLVWLWMTGEWPTNQVDHVDCDKTNNRWCNLRAATNSENKANGRTYKKKSGLPKGVTLQHGKYVAQIVHNYKHYHEGCFDNPNDAHQAHIAAAKRLHGEFAREG